MYIEKKLNKASIIEALLGKETSLHWEEEAELNEIKTSFFVSQDRDKRTLSKILISSGIFINDAEDFKSIYSNLQEEYNYKSLVEIKLLKQLSQPIAKFINSLVYDNKNDERIKLCNEIKKMAECMHLAE